MAVKKKAKTSSKVEFISPPLVAVYPWLTHPDTGNSKYADGKYKTGGRAAPDTKGLQEFVAFLKKNGMEMHPGQEEGDLKFGFKIEDDGTYLFKFKSKFAPAIIDPKNQPINVKKLGPDFRIGGGSVIKVAGVLFKYEGKDGEPDGISLQMNQVKLLKLVAGRASMFTDEEEEDADFDADAWAAENVSGEEATEASSDDNDLGI